MWICGKESSVALLCCQLGLANEISNLRLQLEDSRKHRFGRTSEQRRLLNNRNIDKSAMEKSEYDGS